MSRWAAAFNAIVGPFGADTVDTVDTQGGPDVLPSASTVLPVNVLPSHSVNSVHSGCPNRGIGIGASGPVDRMAFRRRPSWSDPADVPSSGSWCSCCHGHRWWTETQDGRGWCCATCHPGNHLTAAQRREVVT